MKEQLKKLKNRLANGILPAIIFLIVRLLYATMRVRVVGGDIPQSLHSRGEAAIYAFWHARLLMCPFAYVGKDLHILISSHGDGEIIANVMKGFGFHLVRGSSSKGGKEALQEMVRIARGNRDLAVTPDGPRGPAEVVKSGIAQVARRTGRPIVPLSFGCSRAKRFGSWDAFLLPYPFSRGVFVWGEPLYCRGDEDTEAFRLRIEQTLLDTTRRADEYAGSTFSV